MDRKEKIELDNKSIIILAMLAFFCLVLGFSMRYHNNVKGAESQDILIEEAEPEVGETYSHSAAMQNESAGHYIGNDNNKETDDLVDFDISTVPTYVDGINLSGNGEWINHYAACRYRSAFNVSYSVNSSLNLNYFEVNGKTYRLPMMEENFPLDRGMEIYACEDSTDYFRGDAYGVVDQDLLIIWGNKIFFQRYPGTSLINAVHIDSDHLVQSDSSVQAAVAGISLGMSEDDVIRKYGNGTSSFQSVIYKNSSGILVVTYNENRYVIGITLYTTAFDMS